MLLHALAAWASLRLAFMLRFYFDPLPFRYDEMMLRALPWALLWKVLAADILGLTRRIWRYASIRDLKPVCLAAFWGSAVFVPTVILLEKGQFPNGPLLLDGLFTLGFFTAIRFSGRFWIEGTRVKFGGSELSRPRILIVGGGDRGETALRLVQAHSRVMGFLDDKQDLQGRILLGSPVLGTLDDLAHILERKRVDEVVIALAKPGPEKIRYIFEQGSLAGCDVSLMPEFTGIGPHTNPIRKLKMSDFLGREPVVLDPAPLKSALGGMTVLVTGAGGSIGSELCRQLIALPVARLLLLDFSETALFEISEELKQIQMATSEEGMADASSNAGKDGGSTRPGRGEVETGKNRGEDYQVSVHAPSPSCTLEILLCDIRFPEDLQAVFAQYHPHVIYHAAACKHVPMMEAHPLEAARTNVLGTYNVVEAAKTAGVKRFLHVSTDKAVEAEGMMGASKAWGEIIVRAAGYSCVRFGNVLGSSGSVIPLFEKQWDQGGQLLVTHRDATRYFMTIEEAVLLILHAEALMGSSEVYILDMGKPVKILDLARQMVSMRRGLRSMTDSGLRNAERGNAEGEIGEIGEKGEGGGEQGETDSSSAIRIIGLRPGERIHERLHTPEEKLDSTQVPKVNKLAGTFDSRGLEDRLQRLHDAVEGRDEEMIRTLLIDGGKEG